MNSCLQIVHMFLFIVERYRIILSTNRVPATCLHDGQVDLIVVGLACWRIDTVNVERGEWLCNATAGILTHDRLELSLLFTDKIICGIKRVGIS